MQGVTASLTAEVNIFGGSNSGQVFAQNDSSVDVRGGSVAREFVALDGSAISIFGSGFNLPIGDIGARSGTLTGFLSDGTPLNNSFVRATTAKITLVPEPSTALLFATGLATMAVRRRR